GSIPARSTAARRATAPSSGADIGASPPRKRPIGVRTAETMTGVRAAAELAVEGEGEGEADTRSSDEMASGEVVERGTGLQSPVTLTEDTADAPRPMCPRPAATAASIGRARRLPRLPGGEGQRARVDFLTKSEEEIVDRDGHGPLFLPGA